MKTLHGFALALMLTAFACDDQPAEDPCLQMIEDEARALLDAGSCTGGPIASSPYCIGSSAALSCVEGEEFCARTGSLAEVYYREALEYTLQCLETRHGTTE